MIHIFLLSFIISTILYMHKLNPVVSLFVPVIFIPFSPEIGIFLAIFFSAAYLDHMKYRLPDFVLFVSLALPIFYFGYNSMMSSLIFAIPVICFYTISRYFDLEILMSDDPKSIFISGAILRDIRFIFVYYLILLVVYVGYITKYERKLVSLTFPAFLSTYIILILQKWVV